MEPLFHRPFRWVSSSAMTATRTTVEPMFAPSGAMERIYRSVPGGGDRA